MNWKNAHFVQRNQAKVDVNALQVRFVLADVLGQHLNSLDWDKHP